MDDLGARLKQARQKKGVSLRDIATATKISVVALEALERNDYGRLPGGIFSRAFVRAYALAVDLDPEATVNEFLAEFTRYEHEAANTAKRPEITPDDLVFLERQQKALRTLRLVLVAAAVLALVAVAYFVLVWWPAYSSSGTASAPAATSSALTQAGPFRSHLG